VQSAPTVEGKHVSAVCCVRLPMRPTPIITALLFVAAGAYMLGVATLVLWLSGNWRWVEGWIFDVWWASFIAAIFLWLYYKDPGLLAERLRMPGSGGESRSDVAILIGVKLGWIAWIVLSPLDVRFGWMPRLPLWSEVCGGILLLVGSFFMFRAFTDNPYLSQLVRIQAERGQHVIDTGVYGFVRHPMYLGASLWFVGGAMLLGSVCGLLVGLALVGLLILRIFGEEKLLARDLEGYRAYREKVPYRLIPHVW
jgi:protein-S-isoprenylcysteine O-methyltransferase Ste14